MPHNVRSIKKAVGGLLLLFILSAQAFAFDGTRKGIVMGIGASYAPTVHWNWNHQYMNTSAGGGGFTLMAGYAWNSHNMIVYQGLVSGRKVDELDPIDGSALVEFLQGAAYYHYFGHHGKAAYLTGGLGVASYRTEFNNVEGDGFGYTLGGGFEFLKQVQFGMQYFGGSVNGHERNARLGVLQFMLTVVAY